MIKLPQSRDELLKHLKQQIGFLIKSCNLFDNGDIVEAKRLAATLRLLLHDTTKSKSLLSQVNKKRIRFYDSAIDWDPKNLLPHHGLVGFVMSSNKHENVYKAHFHTQKVSNSRQMLFDKWWNKIIIFDSKKNKFTRKSLVLSVTDTDGGAHIDPELEESYTELTRFNSVGWKFILNGKEYDYEGIELHSIRQITQEVLDSLKLDSPKLFS